jgi:hypothetical protein
MKIKITKCSNALYWYNKHIGEVLDVVRFEKHSGIVWCREQDEWKSLNFVELDDLEILADIST